MCIDLFRYTPLGDRILKSTKVHENLCIWAKPRIWGYICVWIFMALNLTGVDIVKGCLVPDFSRALFTCLWFLFVNFLNLLTLQSHGESGIAIMPNLAWEIWIVLWVQVFLIFAKFRGEVCMHLNFEASGVLPVQVLITQKLCNFS